MIIYILRVYPDCHKWCENAATIGFFTSKTALRKAIKKNARALGIRDKKAFEEAFRRISEPWSWRKPSINDWMDTGSVEMHVANEIYYYDEDSEFSD